MDVPEIRFTRSVGDVDIACSEFGREDGSRVVFVCGFVSLLELNWESPVVAGVMDACGWDEAHVPGVSEGGPMAILLAATYPDRVTSLSLDGTFARAVCGGRMTGQAQIRRPGRLRDHRASDGGPEVAAA